MVEEGRQKETTVEIILSYYYPDTYLFILTEDALSFITWLQFFLRDFLFY